MVECMQSNATDPEISALVEDYLWLRGESTMQASANPFLPRRYHLLVKYHDKLGLQNFPEGRFFSYYVQLECDYISTCETYQTAETWDLGFIEQLIRITHWQWLHRNAKVYFKWLDGWTRTDPDDMLEEDKALPKDDFGNLRSPTAKNR